MNELTKAILKAEELALSHKREQVKELIREIVNKAHLTNQKYNKDTIVSIKFKELIKLKDQIFSDCKEETKTN